MRRRRRSLWPWLFIALVVGMAMGWVLERIRWYQGLPDAEKILVWALLALGLAVFSWLGRQLYKIAQRRFYGAWVKSSQYAIRYSVKDRHFIVLPDVTVGTRSDDLLGETVGAALIIPERVNDDWTSDYEVKPETGELEGWTNTEWYKGNGPLLFPLNFEGRQTQSGYMAFCVWRDATVPGPSRDSSRVTFFDYATGRLLHQHSFVGFLLGSFRPYISDRCREFHNMPAELGIVDHGVNTHASIEAIIEIVKGAVPPLVVIVNEITVHTPARLPRGIAQDRKQEIIRDSAHGLVDTVLALEDVVERAEPEAAKFIAAYRAVFTIPVESEGDRQTLRELRSVYGEGVATTLRQVANISESKKRMLEKFHGKQQDMNRVIDRTNRAIDRIIVTARTTADFCAIEMPQTIRRLLNEAPD